MTMKVAGILQAILVMAVATLLGGCASGDGEVFYRLSADGKMPSSGAAGTSKYGLRPVDLPDYIDRGELVFQSTSHRYEMPPNHRWTGSLRDNVGSVLAVNLGSRKGTVVDEDYPWSKDAAPQYQVAVIIREFHAVSGGDAILDVRWEVYAKGESGSLRRGGQVFTEELTEDGYDGVVAAQSRLLGQLADSIAKDLP